MPDPKNFKDQQSFISECIRENIKEGKTKEQAVGKCYGMWRNAKKAECEKNIIKAQAELYKIEKAKESKYINSDGTFKGGFNGCVSHFMEVKGLKKENAEKLCAYINRRKGK